MPISKSAKQLFGGIVAMAIGLILVALVLFTCPMDLSLRFWVAGAGVLGLVSGFTTGVSNQPGSGTEFVKFLGAGVLVPLVGGVAALLARTEEVTETSTYADAQLIEKITTTVTTVDASLHPLTVLGSFFVMFGLLAILGILGGVLLRKGGLPAVMAA